MGRLDWNPNDRNPTHDENWKREITKNNEKYEKMKFGKENFAREDHLDGNPNDWNSTHDENWKREITKHYEKYEHGVFGNEDLQVGAPGWESNRLKFHPLRKLETKNYEK